MKLAALHLPTALAATTTKTVIAAGLLVGVTTAATVSVVAIGSSAVAPSSTHAGNPRSQFVVAPNSGGTPVVVVPRNQHSAIPSSTPTSKPPVTPSTSGQPAAPTQPSAAPEPRPSANGVPAVQPPTIVDVANPAPATHEPKPSVSPSPSHEPEPSPQPEPSQQPSPQPTQPTPPPSHQPSPTPTPSTPPQLPAGGGQPPSPYCNSVVYSGGGQRGAVFINRCEDASPLAALHAAIRILTAQLVVTTTAPATASPCAQLTASAHHEDAEKQKAAEKHEPAKKHEEPKKSSHPKPSATQHPTKPHSGSHQAAHPETHSDAHAGPHHH